MPSLFRYFNADNALAFVQEGQVLMRSLSYFRDYEDAQVRSDRHEGTLVHHTSSGIELNNISSGELINLPYRLESTVKEDDIFIYCMSTELSSKIATEFKAEVAVEILEPIKFLALLRSSLALRRRFKTNHLIHQNVQYYEWSEPPIIDWALPERISMRKPKAFSWQKEYRFAVPIRNAFSVGNVSVNLVPLDKNDKPRAMSHPEQLLKLGNLSKICRTHLF